MSQSDKNSSFDSFFEEHKDLEAILVNFWGSPNFSQLLLKLEKKFQLFALNKTKINLLPDREPSKNLPFKTIKPYN